MFASHPNSDGQQAEQTWLAQLVIWTAWVFMIAGLAALGWYLFSGAAVWAYVSLVCTAYGGSHFWSHAQIRRGQIASAVLRNSLAAFGLSLAAALLAPSALPLLLLVPPITVSQALPHLSTRALRVLIGGALLQTALLALAADRADPFPKALHFSLAPLLLLGLAEVGLLLWYMWRYRARLNDLLEASKAANVALHHGQEWLEREVYARTAALRASEARYRAIVEMTHDYIYALHIRPQGQVVVEWIAEAFTNVTGYTATELNQAGGWAQLVHPDDLQAVRAHSAHLHAGEPGMMEYRIITKHHEVRWLRDYRRPVHDAAQPGAIYITGAAQDLTAQKQADAQINAINRKLTERVAELQQLQKILHNQSIRDGLTGLFNRRYMEETLELEASRAQRHGHTIGVIMLDIDHFKRFNDMFGHAAGDLLLRETGALLQHNIRSSDIACRYGGEEFMIIMPETSEAALMQRAEELRASIKRMELHYLDQPLGQVTISAGVALLPLHGSTAAGVLDQADAALYRSKHAGRDRVTMAGEAAWRQLRKG